MIILGWHRHARGRALYRLDMEPDGSVRNWQIRSWTTGAIPGVWADVASARSSMPSRSRAVESAASACDLVLLWVDPRPRWRSWPHSRGPAPKSWPVSRQAPLPRNLASTPSHLCTDSGSTLFGSAPGTPTTSSSSTSTSRWRRRGDGAPSLPFRASHRAGVAGPNWGAMSWNRRFSFTLSAIVPDKVGLPLLLPGPNESDEPPFQSNRVRALGGTNLWLHRIHGTTTNQRCSCLRWTGFRTKKVG